MSNQPWHADTDLIGAYARGQLDAAAEASVETHVTRCPSCRAVATDVVPASAATAGGLAPSSLWDAVATRIAAPRTGPVGRALRRLGMSEPDLVVLRASRSLTVPFALSLLVALCFAFLAGQLSAPQQRGWLLLVAPLVPALLVAAAYDLTDPLRGISDTTPLSQVRVALLRTIVAVAAALPVVALLARVPQVGLSPSAWLLPSLTLTVLTLVLLTRWSASVAVASVAGAWSLAVATMSGLTSTTVAGTWPVQLALLVLLALVTAAWLARLGLLTPTEVRP